VRSRVARVALAGSFDRGLGRIHSCMLLPG
jgi:hypothetical protein